MIRGIDAHLSPALARWMRDTFGLEAHAVRDLGLRDAKDLAIFHAARQAGTVAPTAAPPPCEASACHEACDSWEWPLCDLGGLAMPALES